MKSPSLVVGSLARHGRVFLTPDSPVSLARKLFRKYPRLSHLPLTSSEKRYLALLPRQSLRGVPSSAPVENLTRFPLPPLPPYATIYDALQQMEEHQVTEMPVASDDGVYLGLVTTEALVHWWAQLGAVQEPGTVLILESTLRNYSLTEIAQCLESDEIRILSAYLLPHSTDPQRTYIVLKVNSIYLSRSIELLSRKGYPLVALHGDALMEKQARDQLRALLRYLDL
ncbi:MAG: CBS domain-containing protein [Bacteroidia bacterium]|nr:CBS domain-containing protein [Bacteroidia bacterium]